LTHVFVDREEIVELFAEAQARGREHLEGYRFFRRSHKPPVSKPVAVRSRAPYVVSVRDQVVRSWVQPVRVTRRPCPRGCGGVLECREGNRMEVHVGSSGCRTSKRVYAPALRG
jgi:hypothetical protein